MALKPDNEVYLKTVEVFKDYAPSISKMEHFLRPPIKFIASLCAMINKKNGFGANYFTDKEFAGDLSTKEEKVDFLFKLQFYVQYLNRKNIEVNPKEIAKGAKVEETLKLLQYMVIGSENPKTPLDESAKRAMVKFEKEKKKEAGKGEDKKDDKKGDDKKRPEKPKEDEKKHERKERPKKEEEKPKEEKPKEEKPKERPKKEEEKEKPKERPKKEEEKPKEEKPKEEEKPREHRRKEEEKPKEEKPKEEEKKRREKPKKEEPEVPAIRTAEIEDESNVAARPMTARKAPPKVKEEAPVIMESKVTNIIKEADLEDDADDVFVEETANGTAPTQQQQGALFQKIMSQLQEGQKPGSGESYDADSFKRQIEVAKQLLQQLARSAQPLDTLIQFSQEDLGNMENEYRRWSEECKRQEKALESEKIATEQTLQDLTTKLDELDKDISRQELKLRMIKAAAFLKENDIMKNFAQMCAN